MSGRHEPRKLKLISDLTAWIYSIKLCLSLEHACLIIPKYVSKYFCNRELSRGLRLRRIWYPRIEQRSKHFYVSIHGQHSISKFILHLSALIAKFLPIFKAFFLQSATQYKTSTLRYMGLWEYAINTFSESCWTKITKYHGTGWIKNVER